MEDSQGMGVEKDTTLVIMAAGLGSRFGQGIKQLTSFGPSGEIIMDYSIYDAIRAGFSKVVFVLRKDLEQDFREIIGKRIEKQVDVAYAFQEKEDLPEEFSLPQGRVKPWGTGQAVLVTRREVHEPFCVINADDYYGPEAFVKVHDWLCGASQRTSVHQPYHMCMAGFVLKNTLSEHGGVTRGLCSVDESGQLAGISETKNIISHAGGAAQLLEGGTMKVLDPDGLVSMNMWGCMPDFLDMLDDGFSVFLREHIGKDDELTAEYLLPTIVGSLLHAQQAMIDVLPIHDRWFGVTYQEDVPYVRENFRRLVAGGIYPEKLWKD